MEVDAMALAGICMQAEALVWALGGREVRHRTSICMSGEGKRQEQECKVWDGKVMTGLVMALEV